MGPRSNSHPSREPAKLLPIHSIGRLAMSTWSACAFTAGMTLLIVTFVFLYS